VVAKSNIPDKKAFPVVQPSHSLIGVSGLITHQWHGKPVWTTQSKA